MNVSRNRTGYNGQIAKVTCPRCGRPETVVFSNFTLMDHGQGCPGPVCNVGCRPCCPELVFAAMLHAAGLCEKQQPR